MGFWSNLLGLGPNHEGITPNENPGSSVGEPDWVPGDPDALEFDATWDNPIEARAGLPFPQASPWSGWPAEWSTPNWSQQGGQFGKLVDTAWDCIDLNSSVLSTMPVYRTQAGRVTDPVTWMRNPDDLIYASWAEFAKQLFWDYQMGEAFVMVMAYSAGGFPSRFRVVPPWLMHVETVAGLREYRLGSERGPVVTDQVLHVRYSSSTDPASPRGKGPLDSAGAVGRMVTIGVLQRYMQTLTETGGRTHEWITSDQRLTKAEVDELQMEYVETKRRTAGEPMVFGKGADLKQAQQMSAKEMTLLELSQWNEARICTKFRVPPLVMGLPSGGDSMTYQNVTDLFSYHDRAGLRPYRQSVMPALSNWALPNGQAVELNGDEYTRPGLKERAEAYAILTASAPIMHADEVRALERLPGPAPTPPAPEPPANTDGATSLSGGDQS